MLRDAKLLPSLFNDSRIFLDKIRLLNRFRQPLDRCMRMRRRYHRATRLVRKTGESSANTRTLLAYDERCSFYQRPAGFADDLVSTNLTEQGFRIPLGENVRNSYSGCLCRYRIYNAPPACKAPASRAEKSQSRGQLPVW